jgi:hypothetical protein
MLKIPAVATRKISGEFPLGHSKRTGQVCNLVHLYIFNLLSKLLLFESIFSDVGLTLFENTYAISKSLSNLWLYSHSNKREYKLF